MFLYGNLTFVLVEFSISQHFDVMLCLDLGTKSTWLELEKHNALA